MALGSLMLSDHSYTEAIARFKEALLANPDLESAHYKLATALRMNGNKEESKIELQQFASLEQQQSDRIRGPISATKVSVAQKVVISRAPFSPAGKPSSSILKTQSRSTTSDCWLPISGDLNQAKLDLRKAISLSPLQGRFYVSLAEDAGDLR